MNKPVGINHFEQLRKRRLYKRQPVFRLGHLLCTVVRFRISIDCKHSSGWTQTTQNGPRMTATPKCSIDIGAVGLDVKRLHDLSRHDRLVSIN
jgi:hypothetical protein